MRPNFNDEALRSLTYLTGDFETISGMPTIAAREPFSEDILDYLNDVSRTLMKDPRSREYSDVITLAFWLRRASTVKIRERFGWNDSNLHYGRGVAFHIAPSNVPANFAYSLAAGLLTGNANIVRAPSKPFPQVGIITDAIHKALDSHKDMRPYIAIIRYGRDKAVNDVLSSVADTRIIWGGDATISEIRKSGLPPRSTEVTFADRFSIAVIDADAYLAAENKENITQDFYNDTYFTDQNACTSPRLVAWVGVNRDKAKNEFWSELHRLVEKKYTFQSIQGINKLTTSCLAAVQILGARVEEHQDNLLVRVNVPVITADLMDLRDNSGYFYEYDCEDIRKLLPLCNDKRCQTVGYFGERDMLLPLLRLIPKGIDRVVPIGKTMDFELLWDGYNLAEHLTRTVVLG